MNILDDWRTEMETEGAVCEVVDGRKQIRHFGHQEMENAALHGGAAVVNLSNRTRLEIAGGDRVAFLHNMCTNEVRKLPAGGGCEAFFLNAKGHTIGHGFLFAGDDSVILESTAGQADPLLAHLDRYVIREDVRLANRSDDWGELLLAGPNSGDVFARVSTESPPTELLSGRTLRVGEHEAQVRRVNFTGPSDLLLIASAAEIPRVWKQLTGCGAHPCGMAAFEAARIENGFPLFGHDIDERNLPQGLARDPRAISFVKGCYIGQETVARIDALGHVNRFLVGIRFAGQDVPAPGSELYLGEQRIGEVTSAVYSPLLAAPLALGFVRRGYEQPGTTLESKSGPAEVVALPIPH